MSPTAKCIVGENAVPNQILAIPMTGGIQGVILGGIQGEIQGAIQGVIQGAIQGAIQGVILGVIQGEIQGVIQGENQGAILGEILGAIHGAIQIQGAIKRVKQTPGVNRGENPWEVPGVIPEGKVIRYLSTT